MKRSVDNVSQIVIGLKRCTKLGYLEGGKQLHGNAVAMKVETDKYVAAALITMYSRCQAMCHAKEVFDRMKSRDAVVWNCLIRGYIDNGDIQTGVNVFTAMDCKPTCVTYLIVLKAYASLASLSEGIAIHKQIKQQGFESHILVATALVEMYSKCGSMSHAKDVFQNMVYRDVVAWNFVIQGYVENGMHSAAVSLFTSMVSDCEPNSFTYMAVLKACGFGAQRSELEWQMYVEAGAAVHVQIKQHGLDHDMSVATGLVDMYSKCGLMQAAKDVLDAMDRRNVYAWTSLILGYLASGQTSLALHLFFNMDCAPSSCVCVALLKACGNSSENKLLDKGIMVHTRVKECGLGGDMLVATALVDMYSKCGDMNLAKKTFDSMGERDVVTWTCLISGYATNGQPWMAIHVFDNMECEPDALSYVAAIKACGGDKNVSRGMEIHQRVRDGGRWESDMLVTTSLLDMYSKCGSMEHARRVFERIKLKDAAAWNSLLLGYVDNGQSSQAMDLYAVMDCKATHITCLAVLKACGNLAALPAGRKVHCTVEQDDEHHRLGVAVMDMYTRCGCMSRAEEMFSKMQSRDVVCWNTLLSGYSCAGDYSQVFSLAKQMQEGGIGMDDITYTCVLTACSHAGMVEQGKRCFMSMLASGVCLSVENYNCMVDLLSRNNRLHQALALVNAMPFQANHVTWHTLLTAACKWKNLEVGGAAFHQLATTSTDTAAAYVALSDIYVNLS